MWDNFLQGILLTLRWDTVGMMGLGLMLGMFVGALPGFTTIMAMAVLLPISFFMDPMVGIPFLIGVYKGGIYGGSVPAILVSMPGTGASVATTFDGPALTKQGKSRKAMEMALFASVSGDLASDILTILFIGPIAIMAMKIGPPELGAIILLSLIIISATTSGLFIKGLVMCFIGLFFSMIGQDPLGGMSRFTFGFFEIKSGIPLLPMLIGLFAIPEILQAVEKKISSFVAKEFNLKSGERLTFKEFRRSIRTIFRSTAIGTTLGIIPGVGQVVSAFVGYAAAKNASKHPETYGKGELDGIAAAEAANNSVNGPTLVPLLTLGIPGDKITAILLGAFIAQGLRPGPQLFAEQGPLVFALMVAMIFANIIFLVLGYLTIPLFAKVVTIRKSALLPLTAIFAFAGSYVYRSDPFDLLVLVFFGIFGYTAKKLNFDVTPMVMGYILGPVLEYSFGQTLNLARGDTLHYIFAARPITAVILAITPFVTAGLWWRSIRLRRKHLKEPPLKG
ncbi:MAG: tripartite tricarboxylate transporter permease [Deltaproteobacteria bacterium]|jgi:putative tricarboxylic transport membrane protein|nr:tripartite tricarboxylate transporter permease [Deltaproteobacteria bacterium]